ncbi:MAG: carbon starvation protein A, partial [Clostridiales bacterium]|nr:carbon starvation protein A [Clostridiales bacterium]
EKEGRMTFYNMMVLEGFIAMVWAAGAKGVYNLGLQTADPSLATQTIGIISRDILGNVGGIIALLGVIVLPITSGDTALRGLRLIIADTFHIDQSSNTRRLALSSVIFALVAVILVFAKMSPSGFNTLWRYFAWSNQTLSLFAFAAIVVWMFENNKGKWSWVPLIPAAFYVFVTVTYITNARIGFNIPWSIAYIIGAVSSVIYVGLLLWYGRKRKSRVLHII